MAEREVLKWITVNGAHIPIYADEPNNDEKKKDKQITDSKKQAKELNDEDRKKAQLEIIQKHNPKDYDINPGATWVESTDDIQTGEEAMNGEWSYKDSDVAPDFTWGDAQKAKERGWVMVYSSKPIKQGSFVSPSKMIAVSYGNKTPYSKKVALTDVAWIDLSEGQFAQV